MTKEHSASDNTKNNLFDINLFNINCETTPKNLYNNLCIQLVYVIGGSISIHTKLNDFEIYPGELIVVLPESDMEISKQNSVGEYYIIQFVATLMEMITNIPHLRTNLSYWFASMTKNNTNILKLNQKQADKIEHLIAEYCSGKTEGRITQCTANMLDLLTFICIFLKQSNLFCDGKATKNELINQAMAFIDTNFKKDIKISDIANAVFISEKYLIQIFKQKTGTTIKQYITQLRISFIKELLSTYSLSPKEAFLLSGFSDYSAFFRAFKKATGDSPSNFREDKLKKNNTQK